jgi:hypothetical protein
MEYRRDTLDRTWHFCRSCRMWPHQSFNIMRTENFPESLKLCKECVALKENGTCKESSMAAAILLIAILSLYEQWGVSFL